MRASRAGASRKAKDATEQSVVSRKGRRKVLMRDEFLDAAARVFARRGYHAASTKEIADEIGMSQSSVYYYFPSKEAALEELCFRAIEGFIHRLELIVNGGGSAEDKLRAAIDNHLEPARSRPYLFQTFINSRQHLPQAARHRVGRMIRRYEKIFEAFFREAVAGGEFRSDLDCAAVLQVLLAACNAAAGIVEPRLSGNAERYGAAIADVFIRGVLAAR
jgi:TetR/AcrR family transcriptional regulator, cholesterol catabolism regulator